MSAELLLHVAEEVRHAQLFKRLAFSLIPEGNEKLKTYSPDSLWEGEKARNYFQGLDRACSHWLSAFENRWNSETRRWINYLLTTYAIEYRASLAYSLYVEVLPIESHRRLISGIIKEESIHLAQTEAALCEVLAGTNWLADIYQIESKLFQSWIP